MSDKYCLCCWEPYCEPALDMTPWEYKLFEAGSGCPCCEGHPLEDGWEPPPEELGKYLYNGDLDPIERIIAYETPLNKRPKWERPADPVLWECSGCGVNVIRNVDDGKLEYSLPDGARGKQWYHSHDYARGEPTERPAHEFQGELKVCEFCLQHCDYCGGEISDVLTSNELGDPYDDGYSCYDQGSNKAYCTCTDCEEKKCENCSEIGEDCTCRFCEDCNKLEDACACEKCDECGCLLHDAGKFPCQCDRCETCGCLRSCCECTPIDEEEDDES